MGNVMAWFDNDFIQASPNKFKYIVFGNYSDNEDIFINDVDLKPKSEVKLLGLLLDNKLTFNKVSPIYVKSWKTNECPNQTESYIDRNK